MLAPKFARREGEAFADWLMRNLWIAYLEARKCKRSTQDQFRFEANAVENIKKLRDDILERRYKPSRGIAFIVHDPVIREIFAAPFRDRVVHHFLYNMVYFWWDKRLLYDSYSCRLEKGVLMGVERLRKQENMAIREYNEPVYIVKMDIQGYFMNLPREGLFKRVCWGLDRQFEEHRGAYPREYYVIKYLWREVIFDDPIRGVQKRGRLSEWQKLPDSKSLFKQKKNTGIVIGNLSSQLLSNIYLDTLDRYIKFGLKYRFYGRYVDDFYILVPESQLSQAMKDVKAIKTLLLGMHLKLHPKKFYVQNVNKGVTFLGSRVYPNRILPGPRIVKNYYNTVQKIVAGEGNVNSLVSYMGHLKHSKSYKIQKKIFDSVGWDYR